MSNDSNQFGPFDHLPGKEGENSPIIQSRVVINPAGSAAAADAGSTEFLTPEDLSEFPTNDLIDVVGRKFVARLTALRKANATGVQDRELDSELMPYVVEVLNRRAGDIVVLSNENQLLPYLQRLYDEYDPLQPVPLRKGIALNVRGMHHLAIEVYGDVRGMALNIIESLPDDWPSEAIKNALGKKAWPCRVLSTYLTGWQITERGCDHFMIAALKQGTKHATDVTVTLQGDLALIPWNSEEIRVNTYRNAAGLLPFEYLKLTQNPSLIEQLPYRDDVIVTHKHDRKENLNQYLERHSVPMYVDIAKHPEKILTINASLQMGRTRIYEDVANLNRELKKLGNEKASLEILKIRARNLPMEPSQWDAAAWKNETEKRFLLLPVAALKFIDKLLEIERIDVPLESTWLEVAHLWESLDSEHHEAMLAGLAIRLYQQIEGSDANIDGIPRGTQDLVQLMAYQILRSEYLQRPLHDDVRRYIQIDHDERADRLIWMQHKAGAIGKKLGELYDGLAKALSPIWKEKYKNQPAITLESLVHEFPESSKQLSNRRAYEASHGKVNDYAQTLVKEIRKQTQKICMLQWHITCLSKQADEASQKILASYKICVDLNIDQAKSKWMEIYESAETNIPPARRELKRALQMFPWTAEARKALWEAEMNIFLLDDKAYEISEEIDKVPGFMLGMIQEQISNTFGAPTGSDLELKQSVLDALNPQLEDLDRRQEEITNALRDLRQAPPDEALDSLLSQLKTFEEERIITEINLIALDSPAQEETVAQLISRWETFESRVREVVNRAPTLIDLAYQEYKFKAWEKLTPTEQDKYRDWLANVSEKWTADTQFRERLKALGYELHKRPPLQQENSADLDNPSKAETMRAIKHETLSTSSALMLDKNSGMMSAPISIATSERSNKTTIEIRNQIAEQHTVEKAFAGLVQPLFIQATTLKDIRYIKGSVLEVSKEGEAFCLLETGETRKNGPREEIPHRKRVIIISADLQKKAFGKELVKDERVDGKLAKTETRTDSINR